MKIFRRVVWLVLAMLVAAVVWPQIGAARKPDVDARAALVMDAGDGKVLYSRSAKKRMAIASLTKLMTALLVLEQAPLKERIAAAEYTPQPAETRLGLLSGEVLSVEDLLYALLLASANDAAVTLAEGLEGSTPAFVREMNRRARELDLKGTRFSNPIGLDDKNNYSTASDMARLTRRLLRNRDFRRIVRSHSRTIVFDSKVRTVQNRNSLVVKEKFINGVKTGSTSKAGFSLVGSATKRGVSLITVLLGAPSEAARDAGTYKLLGYGFGMYESVRPVRLGVTYGDVDVKFRDTEVKFVAARGLKLTKRKGQRVILQKDVPANVEETRRGMKVGKLTALVDGERAASVNLIAARTVSKAGIIQRGFYYLMQPWSLILLISASLASGLAIRKVGRRR